LADKSQPLAERKAMYAPWSPDQMAQRRKDLGLIGPGTTKPVPPPAFPSYLKQPDSIEQLMPQARAAVRQTGGRTDLGLVDPGKIVVASCATRLFLAVGIAIALATGRRLVREASRVSPLEASRRVTQSEGESVT
jgi:hypothetical protein